MPQKSYQPKAAKSEKRGMWREPLVTTIVGVVLGFVLTAMGAVVVHYGFIVRLDERVNALREDEYFKDRVRSVKKEMEGVRDRLIRDFPTELDLVSLSGRVPVGTIIPFYGEASPSSDYLVCDSRVFARSDYPKLYDLLTSIDSRLREDGGRARTPNLSNRFLRGADGDNRKAGQLEEDAIKRHEHPHTHAIATPESRGGIGIDQKGAGAKFIIASGGNGADSKYSLVSTESIPTVGRVGPVIESGGGRGFANETRPMNMAVLFLIRAR